MKKISEREYISLDGCVVFVYLFPGDMDGQDFKNFHIIETKYDASADELVYKERKSYCGRYDVDMQFSIVDSQIILPEGWIGIKEKLLTYLYDANEYLSYVRTFMSEKQNSGDDICGHCVAKFYKFEQE